jgi:hypothetical protein
MAANMGKTGYCSGVAREGQGGGYIILRKDERRGFRPFRPGSGNSARLTGNAPLLETGTNRRGSGLDGPAAWLDEGAGYIILGKGQMVSFALCAAEIDTDAWRRERGDA